MNSADSSAPAGWRPPWTPLLAGAVALSAAWPALRNGWSGFDEAIYVRNNLFLRSFDRDSLTALATRIGGSGQYEPVTMLSYALNFALFGDDVTAFHAVDVLLYALTTALVAAIALRVLRDLPGARAREVRLGAFVAGALFAVHPAHVTNFAWIADRKDLVAVPLVLLAFLVARWARRTDDRRWRLVRHLSGLALFCLALGAKITVSPLGVLIMLDAALFDPGLAGRPWRERCWHGGRAGAVYLVVGLLGTAGFLLGQQGYPPLPSDGPDALSQLLLVLRGQGHYARTIVWPTSVQVEHWLQLGALAVARDLLPLFLGLLGLGVALARPGRHRAPLAFGAAWFFLSLGPVANVFWHGHYASDHYLLLPSVGAALAAGGLVVAACRTRWERPALGAAVALGAVLLVLTGRAIPAWNDPRSLWTRALELNPGNEFARANLALILLAAGEEEQAESHLAELTGATSNHLAFVSVRVAFLDHKGQSARAEVLLEEQLASGQATDPTAVQLQLAQRALGRGELSRAGRLIADRLDVLENDATALTLAGKVALAKGEHRVALGLLERAVFIGGATVDATYHAAVAALRARDLDRAARFLKLLEGAGVEPRTRLLAAWIALGRGEHEAARAILRELEGVGGPGFRQQVAQALSRATSPLR